MNANRVKNLILEFSEGLPVSAVVTLSRSGTDEDGDPLPDKQKPLEVEDALSLLGLNPDTAQLKKGMKKLQKQADKIQADLDAQIEKRNKLKALVTP